MRYEEAVALVKKTRLVAILRGIPLDKAVPVAQALYEGGVRVLEFTFDHDDPACVEHTCQRVSMVREALGDKLMLGCGTVLTPEEVRKAREAGAQIIISPSVEVDVIAETRKLGLVSMPGVLTPTEITAAYRAGADFVKLFPAGVLGVGYVRAVRGPLGFIPMTAVGGVRPENVAEFLDAGCAGFGVGSEMVQKAAVKNGDYEAITRRAREFVDAIQAWEAQQA